MKYNTDPDLLKIIAALEKRLSSLERAPRAIATSIDSGVLRILDGSGNAVAYEGSLAGAPIYTGDTGALFYRSTLYGHTIAFQIAGGFVGIWDQSGNIVFSDDATSGQGVATPYIPIMMGDNNTSSGTTVTSGTFTEVSLGRSYVMHPKILWEALVLTGAATTAECAMFANGTQVGAAVACGAGITTIATNPSPDAHGLAFKTLVDWSFRVRRVSGANNVQGRMCSLIGVQS